MLRLGENFRIYKKLIKVFEYKADVNKYIIRNG